MVEKQKSIVTEYTGVKELETLNSGKKYSYHIFVPVESYNDIKAIKIRYDNPGITDLVLKLQGKYELNWSEDESKPKRIFNKKDTIAIVIQEEDNSNNKKAKDCSVCLEKITYSLSKCEDWETKRKSEIEKLKKGNCFHEKILPTVLDFASKPLKHKKNCSKCQKLYVSHESNGFGDEKKLTHTCSQKPDNQRDEEEDNGNDNSNNNKIAEKSTVRKYCKSNGIQRLEYDEETGKLIITYKNKSKPKSELDNLNEELQAIKNYLEKQGNKDNKNKKRFLTESDWEENSKEVHQNKTDYTPYLIASGIGLFIIVLIAVIGLVRKSD